jgi:cell division transport system ATP-binding protein
VLALLQMPTGGRLTMFGEDVAQLRGDLRAAFRRRIGMVFQDLRLLDHLSVFDNVALPLRINGGRDEQIRSCVTDMLKWLGLREVIDARPTALSMGERQLVGVARAVIARPSLLLCDEPTNNIDAKLAGQLMHLFAQLRKLGTTVVLATHSEDLLERHPYPVLRLAAGRLSGPVQPASALAAAD